MARSYFNYESMLRWRAGVRRRGSDARHRGGAAGVLILLGVLAQGSSVASRHVA